MSISSRSLSTIRWALTIECNKFAETLKLVATDATLLQWHKLSCNKNGVFGLATGLQRRMAIVRNISNILLPLTHPTTLPKPHYLEQDGSLVSVAFGIKPLLTLSTSLAASSEGS